MRHVVSRSAHRKMVDTMAPDDSPTAREILLRLVDELYRALVDATLAREQGDHMRARQLLRRMVTAFEHMNAALAAVDEQTRREIMPTVLEATAAEALLMANAHAAERNFDENELHYATAIQAARRAAWSAAFEGRARSSYGAVLAYYGQYDAAITELSRARQLLRNDELGSWVQATTRLAYAYHELGRTTDAIAVLQETIYAFESRPYQRPQPLTSHHIAAAVLLVRLRVRNGQRPVANKLCEQIEQRLASMPGLHSTPEYQDFLVLRSIGYWRYEFRQRGAKRRLQL